MFVYIAKPSQAPNSHFKGAIHRRAVGHRAVRLPCFASESKDRCWDGRTTRRRVEAEELRVCGAINIIGYSYMYVIHHQELENFHGVLGDISYGRSTSRVRDFIIQAFVKGARCGNAHHCELEGSTAVFSKRRFRDRRRIVECMHLLWVRKRLVTSPPIHSRYLFHTPDGIVLLSVSWRGLEIIPCG